MQKRPARWQWPHTRTHNKGDGTAALLFVQTDGVTRAKKRRKEPCEDARSPLHESAAEDRLDRPLEGCGVVRLRAEPVAASKVARAQVAGDVGGLLCHRRVEDFVAVALGALPLLGEGPLGSHRSDERRLGDQERHGHRRKVVRLGKGRSGQLLEQGGHLREAQARGS
eukprot:5500009-Prymnesium_polylepis.2